jgi:hypothetical protein
LIITKTGLHADVILSVCPLWDLNRPFVKLTRKRGRKYDETEQMPVERKQIEKRVKP